jgi:uncharacterized protein YbjQ (UPF0145 family)
MPTKIKLRIFQARDLAIMDHTNNTTDAYVEVKLSDFYDERTDVQYKNLNPRWDADFVIEVTHDGDIMKHPLEIKVWDRDVLSSDDIIGIVLIDLSNLLLSEATEIAGWFPIYDTMRGVRGELRLSVSVLYFGKATGSGADSTDAVLFSFGAVAPPNMQITQVLGFAEELLVDDDPQFSTWKDPFRSSRTTNQNRQYVLQKLSAKLRREIGTKVVELGGNAVIGFKKYVDYESEGIIVMRGFGTAVTLKKLRPQIASLINSGPIGSPMTAYSAEEDPSPMRSSDATFEMDDLSAAVSTVPLASMPSQMSSSSGSLLSRIEKTRMEPHQFSVLKMHAGDIQLLTISQFPPPTVVRIAGVVTAHAIKIFKKGSSEEKGRVVRDRWWSELRAEVKNHARFVGCQYVLGYRETTVSFDDMILLTASGTAANLKVLTSPTAAVTETPSTLPAIASDSDSTGSSIPASPASLASTSVPTASLMSTSVPIPSSTVFVGANPLASTLEIPQPSSFQTSYMSAYGTRSGGSGGTLPTDPFTSQWQHNACGSCHIPYKYDRAPYKLKMERCGVCGRKMVPEILLATIEPPPGISVIGQGQLIEAYGARPRKKGDDAATQVGEALPFLEFDLFKQLMNKMKMLGMNACFKLTMKISVGETIVVGQMQATAMCLAALPKPSELRAKTSSDATPRSKMLHTQFAKLSAEASQALAAAPIELYPDYSMPLLWKRNHPALLGHGNVANMPRPTTGVSLEDLPTLPLAGGLDSRHPGSLAFGGSTGMQSQGPLEGGTRDSFSGGVGPAELHLEAFDIDEEEGTHVTSREMKEAKQPSYLVELENELDEELLALLVSASPIPQDFAMCSTQVLPGTKSTIWHNMQLLTLVRIVEWSNPRGSDKATAVQLRRAFAAVFHSLHSHLSLRMYLVRPCAIVGVKTELRISDGDEIQITFSGMVLFADQRWKSLPLNIAPPQPASLGILEPHPAPAPSPTNSAHATPVKSKRSGTVSEAPSKDKESKDKEKDQTKESSKEKDKERTKDSSKDKESAKEKDKESTKDKDTATKDKDKDLKDAESKPKRKKFKKMGSSELIIADSSVSTTVAATSSSAATSGKEGEKKKNGANSGLNSSPTTPRKASEKDISKLATLAPSMPSLSGENGESAKGVGGLSALPPLAAKSIQANVGNSLLAAMNSSSDSVSSTPVVPYVEITPLNYIPGSSMEKFVGSIHLSFIKESFGLKNSDDMNVFTQNLILEAQKIARAHVLSLGGNVLASFNLDLAQKFKSAKGQGYCLLTITGDAMLATPLGPSVGIGYRKLASAQTRFTAPQYEM